MNKLRDVPFAGHQGTITRLAQDISDGDAMLVEVPAIARLLSVIGHVAYARLVGVKSGEQRSASGAAAASVIELGKAQALVGKPVEIGRWNFAAVTADVRKAHVIHQNDGDVWALGRGRQSWTTAEADDENGSEEKLEFIDLNHDDVELAAKQVIMYEPVKMIEKCLLILILILIK